MTDKNVHPPFDPSTQLPPHPSPLRISFLGFNPFGDGYDGRGKIDLDADRTFASLDTLGALRLIRKHFGINGNGRHRNGDHPPFDLRITGYSFGGWSALQLVHALAPMGRLFQVRIGLVDAVSTFRPRSALRIFPLSLRFGGEIALPLPWLRRGPLFASRPPYAVWAENYFQTKGLICRYHGQGMRLPFHPKWFASQPIDGFENHDVSAEMDDGGAHIAIADKYGPLVARETFTPVSERTREDPDSPANRAKDPGLRSTPDTGVVVDAKSRVAQLNLAMNAAPSGR